MRSSVVLLLAAARLITGSPIIESRETYTLEGLAAEFRGLYWNYAFQTDEDGNQECSNDNLNVLVPALRASKDFMGLLTDTTRKDYNNDGAWNQFYIRPNPNGKTIVTQDWNFNDINKAAFQAINDNVKLAASYPFRGTTGRKASQVSIRCKEAVPNYKACAKNAQLPAYTTSPTGTGDNTWITLCPSFFGPSIAALYDVTAGTPKKSSELYTLRTREHILAHEFMHCDRFGYRTHIEDLSDPAVDGLVYGGSRCSDYGWLYKGSSPSQVNVKQEINADTYGWWFTAVWFQTKWSWPYDITSTTQGGSWTDANGIINPFNDTTTDEGSDDNTPAPITSSTVPAPTSSSQPIPSQSPPPAYAAGTCCFHLTETQVCESDDKNLFAVVKMVDNNKSDIGDTAVNDANPFGEPINASGPYSFMSKLPKPLVIVGEHENDYVQFTYGSLLWTSRTTSGPATCSLGGWDPRDGPVCVGRAGPQNAVNNMDCCFPC